MKKLKSLAFIHLIMPTLIAAPPLPPRPSPSNPPSLTTNSPIYTAPPQPGYSSVDVLNPPEPPIPPSTAAGTIDIGRKTNTMFSEANSQAIHWMNLNDAQAFRGTWLDGGSILKDILTEDQWAAGMRETRIDLGPVHSRKVSNFSITNSLPFGAQGSFLIIKYETRFQRMSNAIETVTLTAEGPLGLWRVIGYRVDINR